MAARERKKTAGKIAARKVTKKRAKTRKRTRPKTVRVTPRKDTGFRYCTEPAVPKRELTVGANTHREALIRIADNKWVNGTRLHYYFFTDPGWRGTPTEILVANI